MSKRVVLCAARVILGAESRAGGSEELLGGAWTDDGRDLALSMA